MVLDSSTVLAQAFAALSAALSIIQELDGSDGSEPVQEEIEAALRAIRDFEANKWNCRILRSRTNREHP